MERCDASLTLGDHFNGEIHFHCTLLVGHKGKHKSSDKQYGKAKGQEYTEKWEIAWWRESGFEHEQARGEHQPK